MESHENTHSQILDYISNDPDLQRAVELLRRERKVSRVALQFEFGWSEWKARKVYEALRYVCRKGLTFPAGENEKLICRAYHGWVELVRLHIEVGADIDESVSQEREEEEEWDDEWEEEEEE